MFSKYIYVFLALTNAANIVIAIPCNFTFIDQNSNASENTAETRVIMAEELNEVFNCERGVEGFELVLPGDTRNHDLFVHRYGIGESFELQEPSCLSSKRFITPKGLNNVFNQFTPIVNDIELVQKIQITECRTARDQCNEHLYPSPEFRYICWQEYLVIKLLAYDDYDGATFDENFYYPSHCSCRLVKITKRSPKEEVDNEE